jgi:serine/threonine-protein kinase
MADLLESLRSALADRYRIDRELGRGGMAQVYLAQDQKHHRPVAIKVLRPELAQVVGAERFQREIQIAAQLSHPHILPLLDSGEAGGFLFYVTPYIKGNSLRDLLSREKQLPIDDALSIARQVAGALASAHSHNVVHRDIKPENILLSGTEAVVADFGIARAIVAAGGETLTTTGVTVGTPAYMSPEQAAGEPLDGRSDVYSLGCVLYEMLAGEPPFTGSTSQAIQARRLKDPVPPLRTVRETVPAHVEQVIVRALAKVPADRFATATQFAEALSYAAAAQPPTPGGTPVHGAFASIARRAAVAAALIILVLVGAWSAWRQLRPASSRIESLVVLPLDNVSGDSAQQFFVDGMHEAIIGELAQIASLRRVIGRTAALRYRDSDKSVAQIAKELHIEGVVQGSAYLVGDSVRIHVQLLQAHEERMLWSETYVVSLRDVLQVHRDVARAIAKHVRAALTPREAARLESAPSVTPAAYEAWLRGMLHYSRLTGPDLNACIRYAHQAISIDPDYAPAFALEATCFNNLAYFASTPPATAFAQAKQAATRALALDETLAEAHYSLGFALATDDWDWSGAEREFRRALELKPSSSGSHSGFGFFLSWLGRRDESVAEARRAEELDPLVPIRAQNVAVVLYHARRFDEAIAQAQRVVEMDSTFFFAYVRLGLGYAGKGMYQEAVTAFEKSVSLAPGYVRQKGFLGHMYGRAGRTADAVRILNELMSLQKNSHVPPTAIAILYLGLGRREEAIQWLERGYGDRDGDMVLLKVWPILDPLRGDARFQALMRRMRFPE